MLWPGRADKMTVFIAMYHDVYTETWQKKIKFFILSLDFHMLKTSKNLTKRSRQNKEKHLYYVGDFQLTPASLLHSLAHQNILPLPQLSCASIITMIFSNCHVTKCLPFTEHEDSRSQLSERQMVLGENQHHARWEFPVEPNALSQKHPCIAACCPPSFCSLHWSAS